MALGSPELHEQVKRCPACKRIYRCEWIDELIPPHGRYAYDLIVEVGLARFFHHRQQAEISESLRRTRDIHLPAGSIHHLCDDFLDYFLAVHESHAEPIARLISQGGGYLLSLDGSCEAGTKNVFIAIDAMTSLVLVTGSMTSENVGDIKLVVDRAVELFGLPLATIRDLSKHVFGGRAHLPGHVRDLICQYHFLENLGTKLCAEHCARLTNGITALKLRPKLKGLRSDLLRYSGDRQSLTKEQFAELLNHPASAKDLDAVQVRRVVAFFLLRWLDDYAVDLKGEYFPFDQPALAFYRRCVSLSQFLHGHLQCQRHIAPTLHTLAQALDAAVNAPEVAVPAERLQKAVAQFDEVRDALRFRFPTNHPVRRQSEPAVSIEEARQAELQLDCLREKLYKRSSQTADPDNRKDTEVALSYLNAYWDNLHGHVLPVPGGDHVVVAPRTNAVAEHRFGMTKRGWRRRLGTEKLARQLQSSRAEEMLVENLAHAGYVTAVFDGNLRNMPSRFAACHLAVAATRRTQRQASDKARIPVSKKTVRTPGFFAKIGRVIGKIAACLP
jgi:hypothetical protein